MSTVYEFVATTAAGSEEPLEKYRGQVLLIVNTASKCGFTPQFEGLEQLYQSYHERGLTILGFPCNQFGKQDPGTNDEIMEFCQLNYGVSFPMFGKGCRGLRVLPKHTTHGTTSQTLFHPTIHLCMHCTIRLPVQYGLRRALF